MLAIGAQQMTDEYDDGSPPQFLVPSGVSRIVQIIAAANIVEAAADDVGTAAVQFRGSAIQGTPTITLFAGGLGAVNTGVGQETAVPAVQLDVDIPLKQGGELELWGLLAGETGTVGHMSITAVLQ